ncbi:MAG: NAD-dependent epimerase/dehydratase family protein [Schaalia turicensis]
MSDLHIVIGAGGLLGGAIKRLLMIRGKTVVSPFQVPWKDNVDRVVEALLQTVRDALESESQQPTGAWGIYWCAGSGTTGGTSEQFASEIEVYQRFIHALSQEFRADLCRLTFFYASSAGGVYAGSAHPPFNELTEPNPLSSYGEAKLVCEEATRELADNGALVFIGRIANLYGPGQNLAKGQGLISSLSMAHHKGSYGKIFVSLDTLRDYIYVDDAAKKIVSLCACGDRSDEGNFVVKLICSGSSMSVAEVIAIFNIVAKKRLPCIYGVTSQTALQARDLRLQSCIRKEIDKIELTSFVSGLVATHRAVGEAFRAGKMAS